MKRAIYLDRDGVINEVIFRNGNNKPIAPWKIEEFHLIKDIKKPLQYLRQMGFHLFVVTNQPDITKGIVEFSTVKKMNDIVMDELPIDEIMICPHVDSDNCDCRKPKPGMVLSLAKKWEINLVDSFLIGDNWKDIDSGKAAGCKTILLDKFYNKSVIADYRTKNLDMCVKLVKSLLHHNDKEKGKPNGIY
jgi:D-glycero-D-manno-heptose 1,7-bisphosphate phosphatase